MDKDQLSAYLTDKSEGKLTLLEVGRHDPIFKVEASQLIEVCTWLRDDEQLKFDFLCNLSGVDTGEQFEVVYQLASTSKSLRVDIKVILPYDGAEIESVQKVWAAANWHEREMWELYGINVKNHGKLEFLLLPEDWDEGFPMRKDWDAPDFIRMPEF